MGRSAAADAVYHQSHERSVDVPGSGFSGPMKSEQVQRLGLGLKCHLPGWRGGQAMNPGADGRLLNAVVCICHEGSTVLPARLLLQATC